MLRRAIFLAFLAAAVTSAQAAAPLRIASLHTITTEIAQRIGGECVKVTGIVGPGVDPHDYEPTPDDVRIIAEAGLVVAAGRGLEGYLEKLTSNSKQPVELLKVGDLFPVPKTARVNQPLDPHWWQSIDCVDLAARIILSRLRTLRPDDADMLEANAALFLKELGELKKWSAAEIARIPRDQRNLVTTHDAFGYFARDFGFTIFPIKGISSDDEPSARRVGELIGIIRQKHVRAIFVEAVENPKVLAEIVRETGAKIGGKLYADGLAEGEAATFRGMYRANVRTIVEALAPS